MNKKWLELSIWIAIVCIGTAIGGSVIVLTNHALVGIVCKPLITWAFVNLVLFLSLIVSFIGAHVECTKQEGA